MGPCCLLGDVGRGQVQPSGLVVGAAAEHLKRFDARSAQARQKTNGKSQLQTATIQKIRKKTRNFYFFGGEKSFKEAFNSSL